MIRPRQVAICLLPIVAISLGLSGCSRNLNGAALGAAAGAAAGAQFGSGKGKIATIAAGTVLGAVAGAGIQDELRQDRASIAYSPATTPSAPIAVHQVNSTNVVPKTAPSYSNSAQWVVRVSSPEDQCARIPSNQLEPVFSCISADGKRYVRH